MAYISNCALAASVARPPAVHTADDDARAYREHAWRSARGRYARGRPAAAARRDPLSPRQHHGARSAEAREARPSRVSKSGARRGRRRSSSVAITAVSGRTFGKVFPPISLFVSPHTYSARPTPSGRRHSTIATLCTDAGPASVRRCNTGGTPVRAVRPANARALTQG